MGKHHIKRINSPKTWPVNRKSTKWITRPRSGSHPLERTVAINTVMKEFLEKVKTSKEVKAILNKGIVKVDGKIRKDIRFPICVLDVITIKDESYRLLINEKGKLYLNSIKKEEETIKPRKIIGKKLLRGNKIQINFSDGTNMLTSDKNLNVSDTLVSSGENKNEHIKFEKGTLVYLLKGKQVGKIGIIKEIREGKGTRPSKIFFQSGKDSFETLKDYAFVIGKTKPFIDIPNE